MSTSTEITEAVKLLSKEAGLRDNIFNTLAGAARGMGAKVDDATEATYKTTAKKAPAAAKASTPTAKKAGGGLSALLKNMGTKIQQGAKGAAETSGMRSDLAAAGKNPISGAKHKVIRDAVKKSGTLEKDNQAYFDGLRDSLIKGSTSKAKKEVGGPLSSSATKDIAGRADKALNTEFGTGLINKLMRNKKKTMAGATAGGAAAMAGNQAYNHATADAQRLNNSATEGLSDLQALISGAGKTQEEAPTKSPEPGILDNVKDNVSKTYNEYSPKVKSALQSLLSQAGQNKGLTSAAGGLLGGLGSYGVQSMLEDDYDGLTEEEIAEKRKSKLLKSLLGAGAGAGAGYAAGHYGQKTASESPERSQLIGNLRADAALMSDMELRDKEASLERKIAESNERLKYGGIANQLRVIKKVRGL